MSGRFAIITGSGFDGFGTEGEPRRVATRFGAPSAPLRTIRIGSTNLLALPRHGEDHALPPHAINYPANLLALHEAGAASVIALNTVGAISDRCAPGQLAIPDQLIDYTWGRRHTIHDGAEPAFEHVDFTQPFSRDLRQALLSAAAAAGVECHAGGVYAATQGPRLETAAEIDRLERDGADYVGMTAMPEASLAREIGLDYACLCLVVNAAAGRGEKAIHDDVESSTLSARTLAMKVLERFFR
jgi:5'-methylthioinosine phosphorylase